MSIPIQNQNDGSLPFGQASQAGPTSYVTGQVSYGWINESWRLFSAQMGPWIVGVLALSAPLIVFYIAYYAYMLTTMFPNGLGTPPPAPTANGLPTQPLAPGPAQMNAQMRGLIPLIFGFGLAFSFWAAYMNGGLFRMAVRQVRGIPLEIKDIFRGGPLFGRMLGATFLLGLCGYGLEAVCLAPMGLAIWRSGSPLVIGLSAAAGFVLVFVLIFLAYGLFLPAFALMADGIGVTAALKGSAGAMKPRLGAAAGFVFVYGLLLYASQLLCGIGTLATVPMIFLICALAYRDMVGMPDMAPLPGPTYTPSSPGVWPPAPGTWPPAPQSNPSQVPQQYPGVPPQASPPQTSPQQYPNFPPQQYSPPPVQEYPTEPATQYPPVQPEPSDEAPPNPWQSRPSPPQGD